MKVPRKNCFPFQTRRSGDEEGRDHRSGRKLVALPVACCCKILQCAVCLQHAWLPPPAMCLGPLIYHASRWLSPNSDISMRGLLSEESKSASVSSGCDPSFVLPPFAVASSGRNAGNKGRWNDAVDPDRSWLRLMDDELARCRRRSITPNSRLLTVSKNPLEDSEWKATHRARRAPKRAQLPGGVAARPGPSNAR